MKVPIALLAGLGLHLATGLAVLADPGDAEALIREALTYRRAGRDAQAFPLLQKAHEIASTPRTAAQLGLVEFNLGYWLDAERHLAESLASSRDPWIQQHRDTLEQNLQRARAAIGQVVVTGAPAGAEVSLNGRPAGRLPLREALRAGEGPGRVEVSAPGYESVVRTFTVAGGTSQRLAIDLARLPAPAASPPSVAARVRSESPRVGTSGNWMRPFAWTAAGTAATGLGFGIYQTWRWRNRRDAFDSHASSPGAGKPAIRDCGADEMNHGAPGCDAIYQELENAKKLAVIGYALGGALAATSVTLFLLSDDVRPDRRTALCLPTTAGLGAACRFVF